MEKIAAAVALVIVALASVDLAVTGDASATVALCGDGQVAAPAEQCDDGNAAGGDGCASNCTYERQLDCRLREGSELSLATKLIHLPLGPATGRHFLTVGSPRPTAVETAIAGLRFEAGDVPVAIRQGDMSFDPIAVPGLACVCVRAMAAKTDVDPGTTARGRIACGPNDHLSVDYDLSIDHSTADVDPACTDGFLEDGSPAHPHTGLCNGRPQAHFSSSTGSGGSAVVSMGVSITPIIVATGTGCAPNCEVQGFGPDCQPCTDDDPLVYEPVELVGTTGVAEARVLDANGVAGGELSKSTTCGIGPCATEVSGAPLSCGLLTGSGGSAELAGVFAGVAVSLDSPQLGDYVLTSRFAYECTGDPPPPPTCVGDCNGTGEVDDRELVEGTEILLGRAELDRCSRLDRANDGLVTVEDVLEASFRAANGCPQSLTEAPSPAGENVGAVRVEGTAGIPGQIASIGVRLADITEPVVAGLQHDLWFHPLAPVRPRMVSTALADQVTFEDREIPLLEVSGLPPFGLMQMGGEVVSYGRIDQGGKLLQQVWRAVGGEHAMHATSTPVSPIGPLPDCESDPNLAKDAVFSFLPPGCVPGVDCQAVRALIVRFRHLDPLSDDPLLYQCRVQVAADVSEGGTLHVGVSNVRGGDLEGNPLSLAATPLDLPIVAPPTPTPTPASTSTSLPTETWTSIPTSTPTSTSLPVETSTSMPISTATRTPTATTTAPPPSTTPTAGAASTPTHDAAPCDEDDDGEVTVDELVRGVRTALFGSPRE